MTPDQSIAMECRALGCQRGVAEKLIHDLRVENALLREALTKFAQAADAGSAMQSALRDSGMSYAEQCIAYVWQAARHVSRHDFDFARTVLRGGS